MAERRDPPALKIEDLQVYYGESHAIQGVSLQIDQGVLAVVGRNGMGKSTLCNTIAGMKASRSGSIRIRGRETSRLEPHIIHRLGVGYVPQGRRVWPSLSVDEHLRLVATGGPDAPWTVDRVYQTFPRLYERKNSGGTQLSGGEQQMLAIGRALLGNPHLLIMDEPTEGLAPVIVEQVENMLVQLAHEGSMAILVVEQNIGVATGVSDHVAIMVNGRINRVMEARALAADRELQQRLLGVGRQEEEGLPPQEPQAGESVEALMADVYRIERGDSVGAASSADACRDAGREPSVAGALENAGDQPAAIDGRRVAARRRHAAHVRDSVRRAHRPHRDRRRHVRYEGARAQIHPRPAQGARHSDPHRRSVNVRQAVHGRCNAAASREHASRAAPRRCFLRIAGTRLRRWPRHSRAGSRASRASAASSPPAGRAGRPWRPRACGRFRWAFPR